MCPSHHHSKLGRRPSIWVGDMGLPVGFWPWAASASPGYTNLVWLYEDVGFWLVLSVALAEVRVRIAALSISQRLRGSSDLDIHRPNGQISRGLLVVASAIIIAALLISASMFVGVGQTTTTETVTTTDTLTTTSTSTMTAILTTTSTATVTCSLQTSPGVLHLQPNRPAAGELHPSYTTSLPELRCRER